MTIETSEEHECLAGELLGTRAWIGLDQDPSAAEPTSDWHWSCGESGYSGFLAGEPNDWNTPPENHQEDCGALESFYWLDLGCTDSYSFFCER